MVIAVDDEATVRALRLFNEEKGRKQLIENGVPKKLVETLNSLGISSIGNLLATIKMAKYYEMNENDYLVTVFTDSLDLYGSRLKELTNERGSYQEKNAHMDVEMIRQQGIDNMLELDHYDKKRIHNLKYFTWIEQQQRQLSELNNQWFDHDNYWGSVFNKVDKIDEMILEFNEIIKRS